MVSLIPKRSRLLSLGAAAVAVATAVTGFLAPAASAQPSSTSSVVFAASDIPARGTPWVQDGITNAIVQVGNTIVAGGQFSTVAPAGAATTLSRTDVFAFDATTYAISSFAPTLNGPVNSVLPGPTNDSVYIAGGFTTVNGKAAKGIALLSLTDGQPVAGFVSPTADGPVNDIQNVNGQLLAAGYFTKVNGAKRAGLASFDPLTGALTPYLAVQLTGHHNYGVNCDPSTQACTFGRTGGLAFAISPDNAYMAVTGNFRQAQDATATYDRDQFVRIDLGAGTAVVDPDYSTTAFTAPCDPLHNDSWVRKVAYSPDGSFLVVATTGGQHTGACDAAVRLDNVTSGSVDPTWIAATGGDSLWAVAISGTAVYIGGHERWANNPLGGNHAAAGAVPRPGVGALDPDSGLPLAWDPGRDPRGFGTEALTLTDAGLWVGSDTDWIGHWQYERHKLAFFPFTAAAPLSGAPSAFPNDVVNLGSTSSGGTGVTSAHFDGTAASNAHPDDSAGLDWSAARGAVAFDGKVMYGWSDGTLHVRTFDGTSFGPDELVDPYHDPKWPDFQGALPAFYQTILKITSMFVADGRLYYTVAGDTGLRWRDFNPDSLVIGARETKLSVAGINFAKVQGAFMANGILYWAISGKASGLLSVAWADGAPAGAVRPVSGTGVDWRGHGLFVSPAGAGS